MSRMAVEGLNSFAVGKEQLRRTLLQAVVVANGEEEARGLAAVGKASRQLPKVNGLESQPEGHCCSYHACGSSIRPTVVPGAAALPVSD